MKTKSTISQGLFVSGAILGAIALLILYVNHQLQKEALVTTPVTPQRQAALAEKKKQLEARREENCQVIVEAITTAGTLGRTDLSETRGNLVPCRRFYVEECTYKVELMFEVAKNDKAGLFDRISKIGPDCTQEYLFASKYGLEAFRDHDLLLKAAVEEAFERGRNDAQEDSRHLE